MFVREVMTRRVGTVDATATLEDMRRVAHRDDVMAVAVVHRQCPVAVLTRQQLDLPDIRTAEPDHTPWFEQLGGQPPIVLAPDDLTAGLRTVFYQTGTSVALVVDHRHIVGLVTLEHLTDDVHAAPQWA
jgi:predicted transcriptional regulator